jgi:2,3-diphosphopglycerate-independent phosphoglycerate mutase
MSGARDVTGSRKMLVQAMTTVLKAAGAKVKHTDSLSRWLRAVESAALKIGKAELTHDDLLNLRQKRFPVQLDAKPKGKAAAAIQALKDGDDFVYVHVEASDEAGHDGDLKLKLKTIENLDQRLIKPIFDEVSTWDEPVCIAVLPDHPTPVEIRTHVKEPVPFIIYYPGIEPDSVEKYDEVSCVSGGYGMLQLQEFMNTFMGIN